MYLNAIILFPASFQTFYSIVVKSNNSSAKPQFLQISAKTSSLMPTGVLLETHNVQLTRHLQL